MTIDEILELMDELLDKAVTVPFSSKKSLVDVEKMREYIDSIRYNMPNEIKRAKEMVGDRAQIITEANQKSEGIIKKAEERAKIMVSNEEIVKQAKIEADKILNSAKNAEKEIRDAIQKKVDEFLSETEKSVTKTLEEIKQTRVAVRSIDKNQK